MKFAGGRWYPSWRAILILVLLAPAAVGLELAHRGGGLVASAGALLVFGLVGLDLLLGLRAEDVEGRLEAPGRAALGADVATELSLSLRRPLSLVEFTYETDPRLELRTDLCRAISSAGLAAGRIDLRPLRRGEARIRKLWVRAQGPLGLSWRQCEAPADHSIFITPDRGPSRRQAARISLRGVAGQKAQRDRGGGGEFHALREHRSDGDRRSIDWKRSARHKRLLSKEFDVERNHALVLAVDCGRQMVEPYGDAPRLDHALAAALALAYVALSTGDKVKLFAFDARVRLSTGAVSGVDAFPTLERLTGEVDYSSAATNYALGLSTLAGELDRRSIVMVFTEFVDAVGAELMVASIGRLLARHVVVFVAFKDAELEDLIRAPPSEASAVGRAVIAKDLLDERRVVFERLRRKGVIIVEAAPRDLDTAIVDIYFDIKRRQVVQ